MTIPQLTVLLRQLIRAQRDARVVQRAIHLVAAQAHRVQAEELIGLIRVKQRIRDRDWTRLRNETRARMREYEAAIDGLIDLAARRNRLVSTRRKLTDRLRQSFRPLKQTPRWREKRSAFSAALSDAGVPSARRERLLRHLEAFDFKKLQKALNKSDADKNGLLVTAFNTLLKAYIRQRYTHACAATNRQFVRKAILRVRPARIPVLAEDAQRQLTDLKKVLAGGDPKAVARYARSLDRVVPRVLHRALLPFASALYKTQTPNKKRFDASLAYSLTVGSAIRQSLLLLAMSKRVQFAVANRDLLPDFARWTASSAQRRWTLRPTARHLSFTTLARRGRTVDGKLVAIRGRVVKVEIRHVRRTPISHLFITDGRFVVIATLPHIKVDSTGLSPGAYVELAGIWHQRNKEALKKPSLTIRRLDHAEASATDWLPWVTLAMNDVYEMMPHSVAAIVSWKPGRSGCLNPVKYGLL